MPLRQFLKFDIIKRGLYELKFLIGICKFIDVLSRYLGEAWQRATGIPLRITESNLYDFIPDTFVGEHSKQEYVILDIKWYSRFDNDIC